MRDYCWDYEEIEVKVQLRRFVVVSVIDLPVELVSEDGELYALWIKDEEDGELWFLVEVKNKKSLAGYLKGIKPIGAVFESGSINVVKRSYEDCGGFELTPMDTTSYQFPNPDVKIRAGDHKMHESFVKMFKNPFKKLLKISFEDLVYVSEEDNLRQFSPVYKETPSTLYELSMVA
ncbi:MAG: hypothetical protein NZM36_03535 [Aquificaceae bacterium]|nr:hypothetical protein [Aquificaceae bacterium]